jgi:hypothetical protein
VTVPLLLLAGYAFGLVCGAIGVWRGAVRPAVRELREWRDGYWKMADDRAALAFLAGCACGAEQAMAARAGREPSRN